MQKELDQMTPKELGKLFPILLSAHNPDWSKLFKNEKVIIENAIGLENLIRIEHIGSTAIANLISKPTIDILIDIRKETNNQHLINKIQGIGYHYIPRPENPAPHMMFTKGYTIDGFKGQAYHTHVRYFGDWDELYFRDYLRQNPDVVFEYAKLKQHLAKKYKYDRDGYTEAKTDFITRINKIAKNINY